MKVDVLETNIQFCHLLISYPNGDCWENTIAYANPSEDGKMELWDRLSQFASSCLRPWAVIGDFNDIRSVVEKKGGAQVNLRKCDIFDKRINNCGLLEVDSVGSKFTWKGPPSWPL